MASETQSRTQINAYLTFNGNCREAMTYYHECFGGDLNISNFEGAPMEVPAEAKDRVLHAVLTSGSLLLMASDSMPDMPVTNGSSVSLSVNCNSVEELDRFFNKLSAGGTVTMPVDDTFWGARFGMLTDKFGMQWMFNYDYPKTA